MASHILLLNGPNINLLGLREPSVYGSDTLEDIETKAKQQAAISNVALSSFQSNHEGEIIDRIQKAREEKVDFIIVNPAAFGHTSVALRDALLGVSIPFIEVHLSNIHAREPFRRRTYLSDKAKGVVCGLGAFGYEVAISYAIGTARPKL